MPREARKISLSGYYHVIIKGIGSMLIFEEEKDYEFFLKRMWKYSDETDIEICAYCLMDNHVHLLINDRMMNMVGFMRKLDISYSEYFNTKYEREGHLFQNRYKSIPIENEQYLINVFRYILNNPVKAGICSAIEYRWSSCRDFKGGKILTNDFFLKKLIGEKNLQMFLDETGETIKAHELEFSSRIDDSRAVLRTCEILCIDSVSVIQTFSGKDKEEAIRKMRNEGMSLRQISRITGIGRKLVSRMAENR